MKFRATFKDPDCMIDFPGKEEIDYVDQLPKAARELTEKFFEYSEYVTIEFDTKAKTATVVKLT